MKLWDKGNTVAQNVEAFTVGKDRELDIVLAKYDLLGSIAHAQMLSSIGLLNQEECDKLTSALDQMLQKLEEGSFVIGREFEDIHSKIEFELTQQLGEIGKKIHSGRSRNDQVLVCLHLFMKDEIQSIKKLISSLFQRLIALSEKHKEKVIPGYTHLQVAMPSSFGLWFGAYAESLIDDIYLLNAAYKICDQNPLGSAAGYGSSFPLNRQMTTDLLGFETLKYNVVAGQMSRGKAEKSLAFAMASVAGTLSRLAMDVCLYMSQNFGFLSFPDELTTGSSIMPHKKNPDVFELIRGRCNKIQSLPQELVLITNNLPSGYHRDLQLLKESLFPTIESLKSCLEMTEFMFEHVQVNTDFLNDEKYDYLYSVEAVNKEVMQGLPFREAYQKVGKSIQQGEFTPDKSLDHSHEGSLGNLCNAQIEEKFKRAFE
ncbi:argininosuccinate lyase [Xanthovirga aplysinae]|uniref:argininosuccinate lyase n=1 Tax=Xanthovirga aplysinae TaxID=2529853 RepID=UPI0012BD1746|nr:argininosuccinate lyase [Xanthovirga aplysinae]MTI32740.1 argininosuccinate lyase [Xanthovirga aplysinae]